jgi:uncharacterized membrane protein
MKNWRVECEEQIMVVSQYVVAARSKAEARQTVLKQRREMIIDKPKEFEESVEVKKITSIKPFSLNEGGQ